MKKSLFYLFILSLLLLSFTISPKSKPKTISKVEIETLIKDSLLNIRALTVDKESGNFYFSGAHSYFGLSYISDYDEVRELYLMSYDSLKAQNLEFRSIAQTSKDLFFLSVASPAYLYKINKKKLLYDKESELPELVYQEDDPKAFYDSMAFWNDEEGIAIGDAMGGCLSVIVTRDGGNTWTKLSCDELPQAIENEGAFAASNSNIAVIGDKTWVATTAGRVFYSPDKGKSWEVFDTPIVKEKETEGIYSIHFYDALNGFAIGGDYTKPLENAANKILSKDGGKTWELVAQNQDPGYRSCVQYIPGREGQELVAIGYKGIDYSNDGGNNWKHLSDEGFFTFRFLNDSVAFAGGYGRVSKLLFK